MPAIVMLRRSLEAAQESTLPSLSKMSASAVRIINQIRPNARNTKLAARGDDNSDTVINALLTVLGVAFFALIVVSILLLLRRRRLRQKKSQPILPSYEDIKGGHSNRRGLTIETTHNGRSSVLFIGRDGQPMLRTPTSPPHSPDNVPEIHITFPDEHDDQGRPKSGRVLVVRVGDNATVGLEPMHEEQLPAYEKEAKGQFYSIDMDQIGGLKEKDRSYFDHH